MVKNECQTAYRLTSTTKQHELAAGFDVWSQSVEGDNPHPLPFTRPMRSVSHDCMRKLRYEEMTRGKYKNEAYSSYKSYRANLLNKTSQCTHFIRLLLYFDILTLGLTGGRSDRRRPCWWTYRLTDG